MTQNAIHSLNNPRFLEPFCMRCIETAKKEDEKTFKRPFDSLILGFHRDELFIERHREIGEIKKDPYKKYFEGGWDRLHSNNVSQT
jgi:hypothetical protein